MSRGVAISPKYGANPSMDICFWCGEPKGVVLCGRVHRKKGDHTDIEAPKGMVTSLEPCDACKEKLKQGVHVIEVCDDGSRFNDGKAFAFKDADGNVHWPTGRWAVVPADAIRDGKAGTRVLCDKETMDMIFAKTNGASK